jgi:hypothetical protein
MVLSRRDLLRASGAAGAGALAGCSIPFLGGSSSRIQWGVTGGTAARAFHTDAARIPADRPSATWRAPLQGPFGVGLFATGDRAFAGTPAGMHAVSLADGSIAWESPFQVTGGGTDYVLTGEGLHVRQFFPNGDRQTSRYGLSLGDGSRTYERTGSYAGSALWAPTERGLLGLPAAGTVSPFDPESGDWGDPLLEVDGELWGTTADADRLYLPIERDGDWTAEAYGLDGGDREWSRTLPWDGSVSLLVAGDTLVMTDVPNLGSGAGATGHDPATGDVRWEFTWEDSSLVPWRGVAAGGTVYLLARPTGQEGGGTYRLAAVDAASGEVRWRTDTDLQFPFAVSEDRLVGTTVTQRFPAPGLVAIGADGEEAWRLQPGQGVEPGIAVEQGVLAFVATGQGRELVRFG